MRRHEKCLLPVAGVPLLFRVIGALQWAGVEEIYVATTPLHVGIDWAARSWGLPVVYTGGRGYEADFAELAERFAPALFVSCDLADLTPRHIEALLDAGGFATAKSQGRYVGLSYVEDLTAPWRDVEVPPVLNVNTPEDLAAAAAAAPPAYPLAVDPQSLLPHEETLGARAVDLSRPVAVDVWTCIVLDGHHRLAEWRRAGYPAAPALPLHYGAVDVNVSKLEVAWRAATSLLYPPKTTWHTYGGRHVSELSTAAMGAPPVKALRCSPL